MIGLRLLGAAAIATLVLACGGAEVEPLDPKDLTLPPDTRQWIADAQDGVIAARASRDNAAARLQSLQKWAASAEKIEFSTSEGSSLEAKLARLVEARLEAAQAKVAVADANVALAERKLDLAYAERAMLHDIASYDLGELRAAVGEAKKFARQQTEVRRSREKNERAAEDGWWKAYAKFARGGKTDSYWTAGIEPLARGDAEKSADESPNKRSAKAETAAKGARGRVVADKKKRTRRRKKK